MKMYMTKLMNCVKSVQIRSFFWSAFSCIWTEYRKIRPRKDSAFGHFSRSDKLSNLKCNPASHTNKITDTAIRPKQQW